MAADSNITTAACTSQSSNQCTSCWVPHPHTVPTTAILQITSTYHSDRRSTASPPRSPRSRHHHHHYHRQTPHPPMPAAWSFCHALLVPPRWRHWWRMSRSQTPPAHPRPCRRMGRHWQRTVPRCHGFPSHAAPAAAPPLRTRWAAPSQMCWWAGRTRCLKSRRKHLLLLLLALQGRKGTGLWSWRLVRWALRKVGGPPCWRWRRCRQEAGWRRGTLAAQGCRWWGGVGVAGWSWQGEGAECWAWWRQGWRWMLAVPWLPHRGSWNRHHCKQLLKHNRYMTNRGLTAGTMYL